MDTGSRVFRLMKNVSCDYDPWVVETQLCKLRDTRTSDTLIGRACATRRMFQLKYGVCQLHTCIYDMVVDTLD